MNNKKEKIDIVISITIFAITYAAESILDKLFNGNIPWFVLLLIAMLSCSVYIVYQATKSHYNKIITNIKKENSKKEDQLYEISLGLSVTNNARFSILEKAAREKHDVYAAATLANLYRCGTFLPKDSKKALDLYECVQEYDSTGMIYWCIGWLYENDYLGTPNKKKALSYYQKSMELGYAKAFNSVGKFLNYGIECQKDIYKAGQLYIVAADLGDINAMLNAAFLYEKDKSQVALAEKNFLKAIENGSYFGMLRLGKLYMDNPNEFKKSSQEIANLMIESIISNGLTNVQNACAYFWLAKILAIDNNIDISKLSSSIIKDKSQYCFLKSYNYFYSLNESGDLKNNHTAIEIWNSLSNSIRFNLISPQ